MITKRLSWVSAALILLTACTRAPTTTVQVRLPERTPKIARARAKLGAKSARTARAAFGLPADSGDFECYAVNVTGPNIQSDPRFPQPCALGQVGIIAGLVPSGTTSISLTIPSGPSRTIQVIGVTSSNGTCPNVDEVIKDAGSNDLGEPYILGQTTVDLFWTKSVTITSSWDSTAPKQAFCTPNSGGAIWDVAVWDRATWAP